METKVNDYLVNKRGAALKVALSEDLSHLSPELREFLREVDVEAAKIAPLTNDNTAETAHRASMVSEYGVGARVIWAMSAGDREAEAQAKKGEEGSASDRDTRAAAALKQHWCIGLRAIELVLAVIAIGLVVGALQTRQVMQSDINHIALIFSAYSSFIIITGVLIIARLFDETVGWRTSLGFSILGVIMFTAAAAVIFYDWHSSYYNIRTPNKEPYNLLVASGVFGIIDAIVFLVHAFLTFRKEAEY